ncbi:MAG: hypothetical protein MUE56_03590 [Ignavibacteria bacterium]|nr:hypothetical protein [Ignavibacteria bacterium]
MAAETVSFNKLSRDAGCHRLNGAVLVQILLCFGMRWLEIEDHLFYRTRERKSNRA